MFFVKIRGKATVIFNPQKTPRNCKAMLPVLPVNRFKRCLLNSCPQTSQSLLRDWQPLHKDLQYVYFSIITAFFKSCFIIHAYQKIALQKITFYYSCEMCKMYFLMFLWAFCNTHSLHKSSKCCICSILLQYKMVYSQCHRLESVWSLLKGLLGIVQSSGILEAHQIWNTDTFHTVLCGAWVVFCKLHQFTTLINWWQ